MILLGPIKVTAEVGKVKIKFDWFYSDVSPTKMAGKCLEK